ncbi:MAG: hypothetical protein U5L03_08860 [Burkholderiaceae bacterium]|nr:hypothetical protein [Burkholderiaceae bacterium]
MVELDLLPGLQYHLKCVARLGAELLLAGEKVGRGLQQSLRFGRDARGLGLRGEREARHRSEGAAPRQCRRQALGKCRLHGGFLRLFVRC